MNLNELNSLKLAIDTSNHSFYNGNMDEALSELVDQALEIKEALGENGVEDIKDMSKLLDSTLTELSRLKDENKKDAVWEIDFLTCKIEGVERITERKKVFENNDEEHPVKVIIREVR